MFSPVAVSAGAAMNSTCTPMNRVSILSLPFQVGVGKFVAPMYTLAGQARLMLLAFASDSTPDTTRALANSAQGAMGCVAQGA